MDRLFYLAWAISLSLLFGSAPLLPEQVGDAGKALPRLAYLGLMGFLLITAPWICGPGMVKLLRGIGSGGVNLPNASYWFEGERRAASLTRFEPYLYELGVAVTVFIGAIAALPLWRDILGGGKPPAVVLMGGLSLWLMAWFWRVMRAFPKPPASAAGLGHAPAHPRRPGR